jgi:hypothetical protein
MVRAGASSLRHRGYPRANHGGERAGAHRASMVGLATGIFTVVDRFLSGRPITMIRRTGWNTRDLQCANTSKQDIIITHIRTSSRYIVVASGEDHRSIGKAIVKSPFSMIIPTGAQADFPIMVTNGALLEKDAVKINPFIVMVCWRKTRSMWLPQVPTFTFLSVRALRRLDAAKSVRAPDRD